jgi:CRP/FNR family transcriptional regulator, cyclic AMP receptor protein
VVGAGLCFRAVQHRARDLGKRLALHPWLRPLQPAALEELAAAGRARSLAAGETLWRRGECVDALGFVLQGRLDVARLTPSGARMLLRTLSAGELVGFSCLGGAPHSADLVAGEESEVLVIPGEAMRRLFRAEPELALGALACLGELVSRLSDELEELRFLDLDRRLVRLLERRARGLRELRVTHEELAQQVAATRENVSRALKRFERRGALRCRRGRLEILELARATAPE